MPASCTFTTEREGSRTTIRLSGSFDRSAALELRARIEREPGSHAVLDFSLVRDFADLGVATLAASLASCRCRVALHGLRTHQLRIFRYFGVDPDAPESPGGDTADGLALATSGADAQPPLAR